MVTHGRTTYISTLLFYLTDKLLFFIITWMILHKNFRFYQITIHLWGVKKESRKKL